MGDNVNEEFSSRSSMSINRHYTEIIDINHKQENLIQIITKQTILSLCSTFTTQIWLLYYIPIVFIFANDSVDYDTKYKLQKMSEVWGAIDCCVNALCVLLAFIFVADFYNKICGLCHSQCLKCC